MANYTQIDTPAMETLLAEYPVGTLIEFSHLSGGRTNTSYKVITEKGCWILSFCNEKNIEQVEFLCELLIYLEKHNFPSSRLIKTTKGAHQTVYEDSPVYMKEYIEGEIHHEFSAKTANAMGQTLAQLHRIPAHPKTPKSLAYGLASFEDFLQSGVEHEFTIWLQKKLEYFNNYLPPDLPQALIHGDLFYDNALFSGNKIAAILDFEEACYAPAAFDIGMTIVGCCKREGLIALDLARALVTGYQQIKKLEENEIQSLLLCVEYAATATAFWRFRQYHLMKPDKKFADAHLELTAIADEVHGLPGGEFVQQIFH